MASSPSPDTRSEHWSRSAIASAIFSVMGFATLWLFVGLLLSALGAVCGHLGRHATREMGYRGKGLATFGVGLGYFSMLSFPVLALLVSASFPAFSMWKTGQHESLREASLEKASRLYLACEDYARENRGRYPAEWSQLGGSYIPRKDLPELLRSPYPGGKAKAYEIVPHERPVLEAIAESVIVIQEIAPPTENQIAVVFADGTVKSIHNPDYESP